MLDHTDCPSPITDDSQEPTVCLSCHISVQMYMNSKLSNHFRSYKQLWFLGSLTFFITATWLTFVILHN